MGITKRSWLIISIIFFVLSIALALVAYYVLADFYPDIFGKVKKVPIIFKPDQESINKDNDCPDCLRRSIDGVYVKEGQENLYPIAIIIENHIDARPSSGLSKANLVFEAEAEGGITRFLAIFAGGQNIEEIGPVRSVRPYFVDWTREFSAVLIHCGGSPEALVKIARDNVLSLNEFYNGQFYWRSKKRPGPHNIYTSMENLSSYLESKGLDKGKYLSWQFKTSPLARLPCPTARSGGRGQAGPAPLLEQERGDDENNKSKITINFKPPSYVVDWIYDRENNDYIRYLDGERHKDIDGEEIRAKNVVIATINAEVIDEELRLKMDHIGEGKAVVCLDGACAEGEWRKKTSSARTRFYNEMGEEFKFNAGTTWIEVVRPEIAVDILP